MPLFTVVLSRVLMGEKQTLPVNNLCSMMEASVFEFPSKFSGLFIPCTNHHGCCSSDSDRNFFWYDRDVQCPNGNVSAKKNQLPISLRRPFYWLIFFHLGVVSACKTFLVKKYYTILEFITWDFFTWYFHFYFWNQIKIIIILKCLNYFEF